MTELIDETDRRLLRELRANGRATAVELAKKLDVPRTTVVGRMRRLEKERVILGYTARVDHVKLGEPVTAFIMVGFGPTPGADQRELARKLARLPGVEEVNIISGEWDILIKIRAASIQAIGDLILDKVRRQPGVDRTHTFTVFGTITESSP